MSKSYGFTILVIAIANFLVPLYFVLKNPKLNKKEKLKAFLRLFLVMGVFTALSVLWLYFRFKNT